MYELIDQILNSLGVPFYYGMPEFDKEPSIFITYDDYEVPLLAADDILLSTKSNITVSVFSNKLEHGLNKQIKSKFMDYDFDYVSGGLLSTGDETYPFKKRYVLEFQIDKEE